MKYLILFIFFYSFDSFCHDDHEIVATPCTGKVLDMSFPDIEKLNQRLEWFGASNLQVANSPCKAKSVPSSSEIEEFIKSKIKPDQVQNAVVNGVDFKGESPILIRAFKDFTTAKDSFGWGLKPASQKNFQKEFNINPECRKVMCAMEKIWGKSLAEKMLLVKLKHNYNTSEYAFDSSSRFEEKEMDDVVLALEDLPQHLIPLGKPNQRLTLFERGYTLAAYGKDSNVLANAVVMFFGGWSKSAPLKRQYATFHEFSHNISDFYSDMDNSPKWLKMSGWTKKGDEWESGKDACFTSKYGLTNPAEDFAESISAYRYGSEDFKKSCPKKYDFLKSEVFKGVEYTSLDSCIPIPKKNQELFFTEIEDSLKNLMETRLEAASIQKSCPNLLEVKLNQSTIDNCYSKILKDSITNTNTDKLTAALLKAGIKKSDHNLEMLLTSYAEKAVGNAELAEKIAPHLEDIKNKVDSDIDKIIKASMPDQVKMHYDFDRLCAQEIWNGVVESMKECAAKTIVADDKKWRAFGAGRAFPKLNLPADITEEAKKDIEERRDAEFIKQMKSTGLLDEAMKVTLNDKKQVLNYHFQMAAQNLRSNRSDWKSMEPAEFCTTQYAPSNYVKSRLPKDAVQIPNFEEWCIEKQSASRKRFSFGNKDMEDFLKGKN